MSDPIRRPGWAIAAFALMQFAGQLTGAGAAWAQQRTEVPIREIDLSDHTRRYAVEIMVGATKVVAGLDTGSSGLRLMPGAYAASDVATSTRESSVSYGSGARLDGVIGQATITIGDVSHAASVEAVQRIGCTERKPDCPARGISLGDYGIQGDGLRGEGFKAILGINMGGVDLPSLLPEMGVKRWIVELPVPGGKPGRLILNPADQEIADYRMFKTDPTFTRAGGMHDAIPACLINIQTKTKFCAQTLLDCGAPGLVVLNGPRGPAWPGAAPAMLAFTDGDKVLRAATFEIGRPAQGSHLSFEQNPTLQHPQIHAGLLPYFAFTVLYDSDASAVGLKPRPDATMKAE